MLNTPAPPAPSVNAVPAEIINAAQNGVRGSIYAGADWKVWKREKSIKRGCI